MNIFMLDRDPMRAAQMHCDKHVVKMPLEYAEMLSLAHWHGELSSGAYKRVGGINFPVTTRRHLNHPCSLWARANTANYRMLYELFCATLQEYTLRYGKIHSYEKFANKFSLGCLPEGLKCSRRISPLYQAMPEYCRVPGDHVEAYRRYYIAEKARFARWRQPRKPPRWWIEDPRDRAAHVVNFLQENAA